MTYSSFGDVWIGLLNFNLSYTRVTNEIGLGAYIQITIHQILLIILKL